MVEESELKLFAVENEVVTMSLGPFLLKYRSLVLFNSTVKLTDSGVLLEGSPLTEDPGPPGSLRQELLHLCLRITRAGSGEMHSIIFGSCLNNLEY